MYCLFKLPFLEGGLEEDPDQPNTVPYPDSGDLKEQDELSQNCGNTHIWNRKTSIRQHFHFLKTIRRWLPENLMSFTQNF
jgi:hypothetical protein